MLLAGGDFVCQQSFIFKTAFNNFGLTPRLYVLRNLCYFYFIPIIKLELELRFRCCLMGSRLIHVLCFTPTVNFYKPNFVIAFLSSKIQ